MELSLRLIQELALLFVAAAVVAYALGRLRIPSVLGYLVAGVVLGPSWLGWVGHVPFVQALGDLGVVLIMFGLGLDFDLDRVRRKAALSLAAGLGSVLAVFVVANAAAILLGFAPLAALFLAAALSICGTAVNLRLLRDLGHFERETGPPLAAVIVVTDIAAVLLLTVLSGIALGGGLQANLVALSLLKAAAFLVLAPAFGFLVVPRLLNGVARVTRSREVLLVTTIALCLGLAMVAQRLGFSLALGAFVMGMVISEARVHHPIEEMTKPLEHVFGTLFFLSVGLSANVAQAAPHWPAIAVLTVLVVLARVGSVATATYLSGFHGLAAVAGGWALVPIGEFSFVIVAEGVRFGVLPAEALAVVVVIALLTSALAAIGLATARPAVARLTALLPVGVLNVLTLLQLRMAAARAVPGLAEVMAGMRTREESAAVADPAVLRHAVRSELQDVLVHAAIVVAIAVGVEGLGDLLGPHLPPGLELRLALTVIAIALSAPSAVLLVRHGVTLATLLSGALAQRFPWVERNVLRVILLTGGALGFLVFLEVLFLPFALTHLRGYHAPVLALAGGLTLLLGYLLWRSLRQFQRGFGQMVRGGLANAARGGALPTSDLGAGAGAAAADELGRARLDHMTVPERSPVAGVTIGESGLGESGLGVTILGIERRGAWIASPGAGERLEAGDEIVFIGSEEQSDEAEKLIERQRGEEGPRHGGRAHR